MGILALCFHLWKTAVWHFALARASTPSKTCSCFRPCADWDWTLSQFQVRAQRSRHRAAPPLTTGEWMGAQLAGDASESDLQFLFSDVCSMAFRVRGRVWSRCVRASEVSCEPHGDCLWCSSTSPWHADCSRWLASERASVRRSTTLIYATVTSWPWTDVWRCQELAASDRTTYQGRNTRSACRLCPG